MVPLFKYSLFRSLLYFHPKTFKCYSNWPKISESLTELKSITVQRRIYFYNLPKFTSNFRLNHYILVSFIFKLRNVQKLKLRFSQKLITKVISKTFESLLLFLNAKISGFLLFAVHQGWPTFKSSLQN